MLTSADYVYLFIDFRSSFKSETKDSNRKLDETVYESLKWYEKNIGLLKGQLKLISYQQNKELKSRVFEKINSYARNQIVPSEPLTEEEASQFKLISADTVHCKELVELIE